MFAGFNVTMDENMITGNYYYEKGREIWESDRVIVENSLKNYICEKEYLDGSLMQEEWFPQVKADIFLSHSHKNEKLIISLVGWLYEIFGLKAFVDSCIWGYSNNLLKIIDNKYCIQNQEDFNTTYSYEKRNYSTSHVHMMLSMALAKMIDRTECVFFINTPESILVSDTIKVDTTLSPWIYAELQILEIIRHKKLEEYRTKTLYFEQSATNENAELQIKYNVQLDDLTKINNNDLLYWWKHVSKFTDEYPLDVLYDHKNLLPEILS